MRRGASIAVVCLAAVMAAPAIADTNAIKTITIRASRDIGFFAGDLVSADVDVVVDPAYKLDESSLPKSGPVAYWLDLRSVKLAGQDWVGKDRRYTLHILYQNFYEALDARQQAIPGLALRLTNGKETVTADVPGWTINVSPLREVAPPPKDDPKDYLRADASAPRLHSDPYFWGAAGAAAAAALAVLPLAADRAWFPFQKRPTRVFSAAVRRLRKLAPRADEPDTYLEALLVLHRGIDQTHGQRVLADDVPTFLERHRAFVPARDGLLRFFAASRRAFFGSDPRRARADLGFDALQSFARQLAAIERSA